MRISVSKLSGQQRMADNCHLSLVATWSMGYGLLVLTQGVQVVTMPTADVPKCRSRLGESGPLAGSCRCWMSQLDAGFPQPSGRRQLHSCHTCTMARQWHQDRTIGPILRVKVHIPYSPCLQLAFASSHLLEAFLRLTLSVSCENCHRHSAWQSTGTRSSKVSALQQAIA
jgi:hypothetical protein